VAVQSGDWKYHQEKEFKVKATKRDTPGPTLYNLKEDIGESNNVIAQYLEIAALLAQALKANPNVKPGARKSKN
jgi:arylsulfatase A